MSGPELIAGYLEHMRRRSASEATLFYRAEILGRLSLALPAGIAQASSDDLADWLYRDEWSQNTKATYFRCLKSFYDWATDPKSPRITGNPMEDLPRVRTADSVARACTDEQLREIMARAKEPFRTWAILAAYQGLRAIEIAGLDREHVTEQQLFVVRGKGGRPRVHDTDPGVWQALKGLPSGPVARRPDTGGRADARYVSKYARDHFYRQLNVETSLHCLRHWLGTTVQRQYRDIRVTMAVLGHRSLSSTQIYTAATDQQQRDARASLPRFDQD